jgi:hypothetical protein
MSVECNEWFLEPVPADEVLALWTESSESTFLLPPPGEEPALLPPPGEEPVLLPAVATPRRRQKPRGNPRARPAEPASAGEIAGRALILSMLHNLTRVFGFRRDRPSADREKLKGRVFGGKRVPAFDVQERFTSWKTYPGLRKHLHRLVFYLLADFLFVSKSVDGDVRRVYERLSPVRFSSWDEAYDRVTMQDIVHGFETWVTAREGFERAVVEGRICVPPRLRQSIEASLLRVGKA